MADRLNDTAAIVRKGLRNYELKLRGDATIGMSGHWTSPLEQPWNAERAGSGRSSAMGVSPQYGGGTVIAARSPADARSSPSPDKNRTVPGNGGSLSAAVACVKSTKC